MNSLISTGLQMMQMDLTIDNDALCVIRALNTISFDDLHKIICHKLSVPTSVSYTFYLPKSEIIMRKITRSFDENSSSRITSFIQAGDTIYYRIYNSEFHIRFSSLGIVDEASALEAKLLVTQGKIKSMMKKENIVYRNHISKASFDHLYELAQRLFNSGMFSLLQNHQFLMLHIRDMLQPVFVENQDHQFLLYFFPDEESYQRFYCVFKDTPPQGSFYKYKQATVLRIAKKPLVTLPYRRYKDSFIAFLDMQSGWEMDSINEAAASELNIILPALLRALYRMQSETNNVSFHELLHIYDQPERNTCIIKVLPMETMTLTSIPYEHLHNIHELLKKDLLSTYLEMDYRFIRQPYKGSKQERRPYLLNVSALGPHIQSHYEHTFDKEQDIKNAFLDMMVNIIEEHGRPKTILVRDRYVFSILYVMCSKLEIGMKIEPRLLHTEAYFADNERVIYDLEVIEKEVQPIKKAVAEQPLQHQYSRKRFKMKGYFN